MNNIIKFEDISNDSINLVGGKGVNLGIMIKNRIPVPRGFCISTLTFKNSVISFLDSNIFNSLNKLKLEDINKISELSFAIRNKIISIPINDLLQKEIKLALEEVGIHKGFAIRSSATAEDLPNMSFAGQQDTYLNIRGFDNIISHIKMCWASLYTERAVIYRKKNNINEENVLISVVIQEMVESKKSGIMFTADPITNNYNNIVIDAGFGLGEALVGGLIIPDCYKVDKITNKILLEDINLKGCAINYRSNGGTETIKLSEKMAKSKVLNRDEILKVVDLGKMVENIYQKPQDIEWAIDQHNNIYILQTRDITSLYPKINDTFTDRRVYLSFNHLQVMPEPIKPLGIDILKYSIPFISMSSAAGRIYININTLMEMPVRNFYIKNVVTNIDLLMADALLQYVEKYNVKTKIPLKFICTHNTKSNRFVIKKLYSNFKGSGKNESFYKVNNYIESSITELESRFNEMGDVTNKIYNLCNKENDIFINLVRNVFVEIVPGIIGYKLLTKLLTKNNIDVTLADKVVSGIVGNITTEMGLMVGDLTDAVRNNKELITILETYPKDAHKRIIQIATDETREVFNKFLKIYGMRGIKEIDITNPRYQDDFTPISVSILNNLKTLRQNEHRENYNMLLQQSLKTEEYILKTLKEKDNKSDYTKAKNYIENIRNYLPLREHGKYYLMRFFNILRNILLDAAEILVKNNLLKDKSDIYYLTLNEILEGLKNNINFNEIIDKRKNDYKIYEKLTPPRITTNEGEIFSGNYSMKGIPEGALVATPVSAGIYEGIARVILNPVEDTIQKGEILVTKFTDPGWTPLFINAKGVILEVGGLMTHGAIIAREYGIPALVGLERATTLINTGDYIRINADIGYVEVLKKYNKIKL